MNVNLITDAAAPLTEVMKGMDALGINTNEVIIRYRRDSVIVSLTGRIAERSEEVWELLDLEFTAAGWGWRASYGNGFDAPRTVMAFDHPITLTRIG